MILLFNITEMPSFIKRDSRNFAKWNYPYAEVQEPDIATDAAGTVRVQFDCGTEALSICRIMGERKQEIDENKNGYTTKPLYVVYQSAVSLSSSDDFQIGTSKFSEYQNDHYRRYTEDGESFICDSDPEWPKNASGHESVTVGDYDYGEAVRCGIHDVFVTACLTRAAAEAFIEREKHNLTSPRIWVDTIPRRNAEMREIVASLDAIADKVDSAIQMATSSERPSSAPESLLCASGDGNEMCVGCNCWKLTRVYSS